MKKLLYIIDDINYNSGAKAVTLLQMKMLQKEYDIYLLTLAGPKEPVAFLDDEHILDSYIWKITDIYATSFKKAMYDRKYSISQKVSRILYALSLRCGLGDVYFERLVKQRLVPVLESFDTVIVVSEASKLRKLVSTLKNPRKIQWIHTDYARWSVFSEWSKAVTRDDRKVYSRFDTIIVLSDYCRRGVIEKIPEISSKVSVIPNLIDGDRIMALAREPSQVSIRHEELNLVTVARIDHEKRIEKVLDLADELRKTQIAFKWYIIGDGPERSKLEEKSKNLGLSSQVVFLGHLKNPYSIMAKCDKLVLLSKYEGTPVTIDEAMVLGIGIIAPKIGGIPEQTEAYEDKYLFDDFENIISRLATKKIMISAIDYHEHNLQRLNEIKSIF